MEKKDEAIVEALILLLQREKNRIRREKQDSIESPEGYRREEREFRQYCREMEGKIKDLMQYFYSGKEEG